MIKKVKNTVPWADVISDFNGAEILETSYEKEFQKTTQREFRIEKKKLKEKVINYMSNGKAMLIYLIDGSIKKIMLHKMSCFPKPHTNKNKTSSVRFD